MGGCETSVSQSNNQDLIDVLFEKLIVKTHLFDCGMLVFVVYGTIQKSCGSSDERKLYGPGSVDG